MNRLIVYALLSATLILTSLGDAQTSETVYSWSQLAWEGVATDSEVLERAAVTGVEVDAKGNVYVATPRWLDSRVPASLNRVVEVDGETLLQPYPSETMNRLGDVSAFQSVLGFEIDPQGRMWVLDMGWAADAETPSGSQKLVILDVATGEVLRSFTISDELASETGSFLNDVVVDAESDVAYISDSGNRSAPENETGIIVYDYASNTARRLLSRHESTVNKLDAPVRVNGADTFPGNPLQIGVNGLDLSPDGERLYWAVTTDNRLYSASTAVLRDEAASAEAVAASVTDHGAIGTNTDGLISDAEGRIIYGALTLNAVQRFDPETGDIETLLAGPGFVWVDSFAWHDGWLYFTVNRLNEQFGGTMSFSADRTNFQVRRVAVDDNQPTLGD